MRRLKALMFQKTKGPSGFRKIADPPKKHPQTDLSIFVRVGKPLSKLQGLFSDNPSRLVVEKICASPFFFMIPFEVDVKMTHQKKGKNFKKHLQTPTQVKKMKKQKTSKKNTCSICFFKKVQGSVLIRLRPGGASVETELVLSTNCTPMRPQGASIWMRCGWWKSRIDWKSYGFGLMMIYNWGLGWEDFANEGSIGRDRDP